MVDIPQWQDIPTIKRSTPTERSCNMSDIPPFLRQPPPQGPSTSKRRSAPNQPVVRPYLSGNGFGIGAGPAIIQGVEEKIADYLGFLNNPPQGPMRKRIFWGIKALAFVALAIFGEAKIGQDIEKSLGFGRNNQTPPPPNTPQF